MGGGAEDWGRFKGGRPGIPAWEQGRESRRTRRDSGAGVALRGRRSWQAGPGCSERRGALARWRVGLGATRVLRATERAGAKQAGSGRGPDERGPVAGGESGSVRDVARGLGCA